MKATRTWMMVLMAAALTANAQEARRDSTLEARLDSIEMEAEMRGVAVTAQRSLVRNDIDRVGYDVEHDEEARVLSVLDMLRKVPFVTVDGNDNIKVKGSSTFRIYKNGHHDPTLSRNAKEMLKAMPASMVRRIEVITEPGAREDAEGVDAILNIVMMDDKRLKGMNGSITAACNTLLHPDLSTYLMTQVGRLTMSAYYGYGGMSRRETENRADRTTDYRETGNHLDVNDRQRHPGQVHYAGMDGSLELDSLNLISASLGGYFYDLDAQGDQHAAMQDAQGQVLYAFHQHYWLPDYLHHSWEGRVDYEHKTRRPDERLTLSYMMALTRQRTETELSYSDVVGTPFAYTGTLEHAREHFTEHTLQLDWLRPLGRGHQVETGAKYIYRRNRSTAWERFYNSQFIIDNSLLGLADTDTRFRHRTHVGAVYADYIYRRNRWSARAGLRYEFSRMSSIYPDQAQDNYHRNLHDLVPQASAKWQMTDRQSLKLGYVSSIQRPGIEYLNPAVSVSSLSVSQGNSRLRSSRTNTLHLIYMYTGRRLTLNLAPAYKWADDGIAAVQYAVGDVRHSTYGNVLRHRRAQLEGYAQWTPVPKTTVVLNANAGYDRYKNAQALTFSGPVALVNKQFSAFLYGYVTQQLPWHLRLTLAGYGQVGHAVYDVYGYMKPWWAGSMSLQRSFLREDRLTVRISASAPFSKYKPYTSLTTLGDYTGTDRTERRSRSFSLSLSYRFGRLTASVKKTETSIANDDVVGGITKGK